MPRVRRTKLEHYPCPMIEARGCFDKCFQECVYQDIYRQAIADARCARLLGIFERRWTEACEHGLSWAYSEGASDGSHWRRFPKFIDGIRDALCMAGIEEA